MFKRRLWLVSIFGLILAGSGIFLVKSLTPIVQISDSGVLGSNYKSYYLGIIPQNVEIYTIVHFSMAEGNVGKGRACLTTQTKLSQALNEHSLETLLKSEVCEEITGGSGQSSKIQGGYAFWHYWLTKNGDYYVYVVWSVGVNPMPFAVTVSATWNPYYNYGITLIIIGASCLVFVIIFIFELYRFSTWKRIMARTGGLQIMGFYEQILDFFNGSFISS